ncbi:unnamed protein product, partial [Oppiella nova]
TDRQNASSSILASKSIVNYNCRTIESSNSELRERLYVSAEYWTQPPLGCLCSHLSLHSALTVIERESTGSLEVGEYYGSPCVMPTEWHWRLKNRLIIHSHDYSTHRKVVSLVRPSGGCVERIQQCLKAPVALRVGASDPSALTRVEKIIGVFEYNNKWFSPDFEGSLHTANHWRTGRSTTASLSHS